MNKKIKITLAIVLSLLMLTFCTTVLVFADDIADNKAISEGKVCRIGDASANKYYSSLTNAVDAATDGDVITVISNVSGFSKTITKTITIKSDNGSSISGVAVSVGSGRNTSDTPGNLTVGGNLKLYATGAMFDVKSGTLTMKDNVYAESTGNYVVDNDSGEAKIIINITDNAELVGKTSNADKGVVGLFAKNGSELNISGNAKITQTKVGAWALKIPTDAKKTVNITGGTLSANWGTVSLYANDKDVAGILTTVNISGGTIKADADSALMFYGFARNTEVNISGTAKITSPTKTLYLWGKNASSEDGKISRNNVINISGGTVEATGSFAVYLRKAEKNVLNISGGTITAKDRTVYFEGIADGKTDLNVSGGTIETKNGDGAISFNGDTKNLNMNISGGTIHATGTGMYTNAGFNVKISGNAVVKSDSKWAIAYMSSGIGANVEISGNAVLESLGEKLIEVNSGDTWTVKDGTLKSEIGKVFFVKGANNFAINIEGGTVTSPKHTIFTEGASTGAINISGGTVAATNGNKTIYLTHSANNMVTLNISGGTVSADITTAYTEYDSNSMEGQHAIFLQNDNSCEVTISGGRVLALYDTIDIRRVCDVTISGNAYIEAKHSYATNFTNVDLTITGGTVQAENYTLGFLGGENTVNMTGGSLIATGHIVITRTAAGTIVDVDISGDAEIYAATKALIAQSGITLNISGGLIDVANTYSIANATDVYAIEIREGVLDITGGKFILGGNWASAQFIAHASTNTDGVSTVNGGLFINNNKYNSVMFGSNVNYVSGRVLYGSNVDAIVNGHIAAPKTVTVAYETEDNLYYFFTGFAATDAKYAGKMIEGASIRLTKGTTGLRFTTTFDHIDGAIYGTLIVPASYLANLDAFTIEALEAAGFNYLNIVANEGMDIVDGKVTIRAAITNILEKNYGTAFAAIAYVKIGDTYYYTAFDLGLNARTVDRVAALALDDLSETQENEYKYAVEVYGTTLYSPYYAAQRSVLEGFLVVTHNIPKPDGATLINSGNECYQYYVADASATYNNYKASLEAAGFNKVAENNIEGNVYTTYTNGKQIVTLTYTPSTKEMRVLMELSANTSLPTDDNFVPSSNDVATTVTQVGQWYVDTTLEEDVKYYPESGIGNVIGEYHDFATAYTSGMGYVIRLADGSFIIIDGGYETDVHADNLYNILKEQAGDGEIVIAAWIFTHADDDHVGAFRTFTKKYANKVTVERFIYNFPSEESADFAIEIDGVNTNSPSLAQTTQAMAKYDGAVVTIAHPGQVFNIRNAKINILFTQEMMQPRNLSYYNSCSMIFNVVLEGKTILFLGDAGGSYETGSTLKDALAIYTSATLDADIIQAAHHGFDDTEATKDFYTELTPDYVFIPAASEYVVVGDSHVGLGDRAAYEVFKNATKYVAGSKVTVLTIDNGSVSAQTFANVEAYTNS